MEIGEGNGIELVNRGEAAHQIVFIVLEWFQRVLLHHVSVYLRRIPQHHVTFWLYVDLHYGRFTWRKEGIMGLKQIW